MSSQVAPYFSGYWEDNLASTTLPIVWDAFKAYIRGQYISAIKQARKAFNIKLQELQDKERACELAHATDQSDVTYIELLEARCLLALHYTELMHTSWTKRAESVFEQGDKNGKLIAMLVAKQSPAKYTLHLKHAVGYTQIQLPFWTLLWNTIKHCSYSGLQ